MNFFVVSSTCKTNFTSYDELKVHRQLHEGGNRKLTLLLSQVSSSFSSLKLLIHWSEVNVQNTETGF
jgi:hypothetical protein